MMLSNEFADKLMGVLFKNVDQSSWMRTFYSYCIDSKYRKYARLDKFLKDQITNYAIRYVLEEEAENIPERKNYDLQIVEILKYVKKNYAYVLDKYNYGSEEMWATADKIIGKKKDDCDGLNSLVYLLARIKGIPSYMLYNAIGDVNGGGHYWLLYFSPTTGLLYPIDATYWVSFMDIPSRSVFKFTKSKYHSIWYLFNENRIFKTRSE